LHRGGNWNNGSHAGVFASNGNNGNANNNKRVPSGLGCAVALRYTKKIKGFYPRGANVYGLCRKYNQK